MSNLLSATKEHAKWVAKAGPMLFITGCWLYVDAYLSGEFLPTVMAGAFWMLAVMQWSLVYMDPETE